jgi:uncharacterized protein YyaL (SSP411 family)
MPLIRELPLVELSPYLRQHTDNPVDWYTWGDEAFDRARSEDRPIFLSIGYSACHWCHVMAHESFEDQTSADALNASFVSIKVDREERPDIDAVYMEAVQAMTGSGGWPMSVFLTPDRRPFYGGTYFPPDDRQGMPSFRSLLAALSEAWSTRRDEVEDQADQLAQAIASGSVIRKPAGTSLIDQGASAPDLLSVAVDQLAQRFDPEWGGFGPAPKFPQPGTVDLALCDALEHKGEERAAQALAMAVRTLDAMAAGGIHDHLGGGFARYSTDRTWLVPHFEKMLYDQAGLLRTYLHGWQATRNEEYLHVVTGIVAYVQRDLTSPEGGVYSAEDADSEGVEGRFYVWTPEQIAAAVDGGIAARRRAGVTTEADPSDIAAAVIDWFGVTAAGNFEGSSILVRPVGGPLQGDPTVELGRELLFEARATRTRPGLDAKVLTEWNAMYASALAEAAAATRTAAWNDAAVAIGEFLCDHLLEGDGRWRRSWQPEVGARHLAVAADYAWLVECFTRLAELTGASAWTQRATDTADALIDLFHDDAEGGFFTTGHDAESLIVRTKDLFDGATPSANSVAATALARLGALTGVDRYSAAAREVVDLIGDVLVRHPTAFAQTALTASHLMKGWTEVVVTGSRPDLLEVVRRPWLPGSVLAWGEPTDSPLWRDREPGLAYVCRNYACRLPTGDAETLAKQLAETVR